MIRSVLVLYCISAIVRENHREALTSIRREGWKGYPPVSYHLALMLLPFMIIMVRSLQLYQINK